MPRFTLSKPPHIKLLESRLQEERMRLLEEAVTISITVDGAEPPPPPPEEETVVLGNVHDEPTGGEIRDEGVGGFLSSF